jgi:hypothetical protein
VIDAKQVAICNSVKERDMASSKSRFSITLLLVFCLLLAFAATAGAKPRKKSKKQKEAAERVKREAAAQWAALSRLLATRTNVPDVTDGGSGVNRGIAVSSSSLSSVNAQFVGDPEAPNPGPAPAAGSLIISEFRLRGPSGANDEFVEIYNDSGSDHTVASISGTGYGVAASDGVLRCTIPNGTVIPARGHFLCVNSVAFSLGAYPAGSTTVGTGDATYTTDIPDNAGIALFDTNVPADFTLANRFDAVGSTSEANTLYKEGTGYPALTPFSIDYSFNRDQCGKSGSITELGGCIISTPKDTDNNAADFIFVDTNGTSAGAGQRLGAPGPEGLSSPIQRNATISNALLDATVAKANPPNQVRDFTSDPANNSTFGTLSLRRRFVNNTGASITRLRFRVVDVTTFPAPSGFADLRPRTSISVVVAGINDAVTCAATGAPAVPPCTATVQGTTLEQPPTQFNGSGFNGSLSAGTVTLGTPLANGASINLQFLLGIQQTGNFKFYLNIEALP